MSLSIKQLAMHKMEPPAAVKLMPDPPKDLSITRKMLCAGTAACVADLATFPFDVAKVRLQMAGNGLAGQAMVGNGLFGTLLKMAQREGLGSWWSGIVPGLQRQCVFATLRIGLYDNIKDFYANLFGVDKNAASVMGVRILSGISSGALAISIAQPTDVVKVRMQAQAQQLKAGSTAGITRSSLAMYSNIIRTGGVLALWTGLLPNMARNSVVNATELVCYDSIKQLLIQSAGMQDGLGCHFASGFSAGFMATLVASPIDVVKTRVMSGSATGFLSAASNLARESGFLGFYKGFTPSFMRLGTWNIVMFISFEQLKKLSAQTDFGLTNVIRNHSSQVLIMDDKKPLKM